VYQVNCTYYDALGRDDAAYLMARAIQFFTPGIPQVYYVGLLAEANDMDLLARSGVGRDINRHHFTRDEIDHALGRPAVRALLDLIALRNEHPAFAGEFSAGGEGSALVMRWQAGDASVTLEADLASRSARVTSRDAEGRSAVCTDLLADSGLLR
jgi:sucrose phosphorylase